MRGLEAEGRGGEVGPLLLASCGRWSRFLEILAVCSSNEPGLEKFGVYMTVPKQLLQEMLHAAIWKV